MKKTKIICTLGPSSSDEKTIKALIENGMNVARFNFSHGDYNEHKSRMDLVKKIRNELDLPIALLLDTKGPEIRLCDFENNSIVLNDGDNFTLTSDNILGDQTKVSITYKNLPKELKSGAKILLDDGKLELKVLDIKGNNINCKVIHGGKISNHKGVNVPSVHLNMPYLSEVDKNDLLFGISQDVDYIAASFVRTKEDVLSIRKFLDDNGGNKIRIISKIENQEGIDNFQDILDSCSGIMVARGDMGVEVDFEKLPGIQKRFIGEALKSGKFAITATQMLESMVNNPSPTRAEISDVANAVFDGTTAIMLSGETANGKYPVEAVKAMNRIALRAEKDAFELDVYNRLPKNRNNPTSAISHATCTTAKDLNASAIITLTEQGTTARRIASYRPEELIIAITSNKKVYYQLALTWGILPIFNDKKYENMTIFESSIELCKKNKLLNTGDIVILTAGVPFNISGNTNLLRIETVE